MLLLVFVIAAAEEAEIKVEHLTAQRTLFGVASKSAAECPWTVMHMNYALDAHDGPESHIRRKIKNKKIEN